MIFQTERLYMRKLTNFDYDSLCKMLQDEEVMYAYEHAFSDSEVSEWLNRQLKRYEDDGFGLWAVVLKKNDKMIGQCGLTMQDINDKRVVEIGYLLQKEHWHNGYATEAAIGCKKYAFEVLDIREVFSIIRENNYPSQNVAIRNGMSEGERFIKHYYDMEMPHIVYCAKRE